MSEILDRIVNCKISIESPVEDGSSFGTILLIGDAPVTARVGLRDVGLYASLQEVLDAGWKEDSEMYQAVMTAFSQDPKPQHIYIAVRKREGSTTEEITETVRRALETSGWYGLALVEADAENGDYDETADLIETTEKIFGFSTQKVKNPVTNNVYLRTFGIYSENKYAHIAWMAKVFNHDPGSETWAFKTLNGVAASPISSSQTRELESENLNYYIACAGKNITQNGKMIGGEWIDVIRFRDWLKNRMQIQIYRLFIKNPKIPYTDAGITLVENQMFAVLKDGQMAGGIAETEYDEDENEISGYTITVPRAASLGSDQRAKRILPDCKFSARLSGAIHAVELRGNLVF